MKSREVFQHNCPWVWVVLNQLYSKVPKKVFARKLYKKMQSFPVTRQDVEEKMLLASILLQRDQPKASEILWEIKDHESPLIDLCLSVALAR